MTPWTLTGAGIRVRSLSTRRKADTVTNTAVAADIFESLDVHGDFLAEISFDSAKLLDNLSDPLDFILGKILNLNALVNAGRFQNLSRSGTANAVNIGQRDFDPFIGGQFNTGDTSHRIPPLTLLLLMLRIITDNPDYASTANNLAVITNSLD